MQSVRHFTAASCAGLIAALFAAVWCTAPITAAAQDATTQSSAPSPAEGEMEFTMFLGGTRVGVERVRLAKAANTWIISSTGQFGAPINMTVNRFEVKYTSDWQPIELHIEATQSGRQ